MKMLRRAVLAVCLAVLACGACWQCRATLAAKGKPEPMSTVLCVPDEAGRVVLQRIEKKGRVIEELFAGELTLLEAAAWFRHLNDNPPDHPCKYFRRLTPGASDGEKACRQVVATARHALYPRPCPRRMEVVARLERELEALTVGGAAIELPW
jgi:hypothetical protein